MIPFNVRTFATTLFAAPLLCLVAHAQLLTPVWTEVGEHGTVARVVVNSANDCPAVIIDGAATRMAVRLPVPNGLNPACEVQIPASAVAATVGGKQLALPHNDPSRVVVIGDTGCRIKGTAVQDCNDPAKWPFASVANTAAESKPDLVIHVGDYLYREEPCPAGSQASCGGTPAGDTWAAWNADFFTPAKNLLAAAPWAFSRGNHESCDRSWRGWFYYLDPRPFDGTCQVFSAAYPVHLGKFSLVMLDSASANDKTLDPKSVAAYSAELSSIKAQHAWLVLHHPIWGLKGSPPVESPTEVTEAWEKSPVKGIDLIVSGPYALVRTVVVRSGASHAAGGRRWRNGNGDADSCEDRRAEVCAARRCFPGRTLLHEFG